MKELSLREIQLRELDLLIQFDSFCKKHDLKYSLCSGTLLGAIRHKGFIPWDDDIDVQMPRKYYDKLIEIMETSNDLHVQGYGIRHASLSEAPFVRVQDVNTLIKHEVLNNDKDLHLYIDILPIDGFPDDEIKREIIMRKRDILKKCIKWSNVRLGTAHSTKAEILRFPAVILCKAIGSDYFAKKWGKLARRIDFESCFEGAVIGGNFYRTKECMPRKEWYDQVEVEFEGHLFWSMGCWKLHLERLYGDYMILPPKEKRIPQHRIRIYDSRID